MVSSQPGEWLTFYQVAEWSNSLTFFHEYWDVWRNHGFAPTQDGDRCTRDYMSNAPAATATPTVANTGNDSGTSQPALVPIALAWFEEVSE